MTKLYFTTKFYRFWQVLDFMQASSLMEYLRALDLFHDLQLPSWPGLFQATSLVLQEGEGEETSPMAKWEGEERGKRREDNVGEVLVSVRGKEAQEEKGREGEAASRRMGRMEEQGQEQE